MGCNGSKGQDVKQPPASTTSTTTAVRPVSQVVESGTLCHFCKKRFPGSEHSAHTVNCDAREVTCWHSWCREIVKQGVLAAHMELCAKKQKTICSKCGAHVLVSELAKHRDTCQLQLCGHCGENCIARILKYCPHHTLGKVNIVSGPFATDALRARYCPGDNPTPLSTANFNVARLQQLWRWMKTRTIVEDTIFRLIHKEMDLKKEGFAIFKAHDKFDQHGSAPKRSKSLLNPPMVAPATTSHYFPSNGKFPITFDHIRQMIKDLTNHTLLPYPAAWRVFTDALAHLNAMPNVVRLNPPVGARVVNGRTVQGGTTIVVGDLHGQLADLLHILRECGKPDDSTFYVFNGDFVDRGPYGVEVLLVLFSLMLAFPKYVALNRGNHECDYMNEEYGFDVEVSTKYDRNMFRLIQRCFCALPLATMVGSSTFIVHGGLPRRNGVTIDDIVNRIQRFRQIPMPERTQPEEDEMFQDLLWSDPWECPGWKESDRGAGVQFGPDVTADFCKTNGLELVIRSHEECQKGYEEHHNGKLVTVFSASNYDGPDTNKGSFIVLVGDNPEPSYHLYQVYEDDLDDYAQTDLTETFLASTAATPTTTTMRFGSSFSVMAIHAPRQKKRVRDEVLRVLRERIYQRRHRMLAYFTKLDRSRKGSVWKIEWVETMRNVLNLHLPWFFLRHYIVDEDKSTSRIYYSPFLNQFRNKVFGLWVADWEQGMVQQLCARQRTVQRAQHIESAFSKGLVNYNEFCSAMRSIDYTMSDAQLFQLFQYYDQSGCGQVDGAVLLEELQTTKSNPANPLKWELDTMEQLQLIIIQGRTQLQTLFKVSVRDKMVVKEKYNHGMTTLSRGMRKQLTTQQRDAIFTFLTCGKEEIAWDNFISGFSIIDISRQLSSELLRKFSIADFDVPLTPVGHRGGVFPLSASPTHARNSPEAAGS